MRRRIDLRRKRRGDWEGRLGRREGKRERRMGEEEQKRRGGMRRRDIWDGRREERIVEEYK